MKKCLFALFTAFVISINMLSMLAFAEEKYDTKTLLNYANDIVNWEKSQSGISENEDLFSGDFLKNACSDSVDWFVIGVSRLGISADYDTYLEQLKSNIIKKYETDEKLDSIKATEWHRAILTVLSCGGDPTDIDGINLVCDGTYGRTEENSIGAQGLNGWIWSLMALDSLQWKMPENAEFNREKIINEIVSSQLSDGGFSLSGQSGEADITAMAVQALWPYYNDGGQDKVRKSIDKALEFLSVKQQNDGTYETCETTAQVVCALCNLGIDFENDQRFIKDKNVVNALMTFRNNDGGFSHISGEKSQGISTAQALLAIDAVIRYNNSMRRVFDFSTEFSESDIEQLKKVDGLLAAINEQTSEKEVEKCNEIYKDLSVDLKTYVTKYNSILTLLDKNDLSMNDESFIDEMSKNETGNGYIYDIENKCEYEYSQEFTNDDLNDYNNLLKSEISSFDKAKLCTLLDKAEKSDKLENKEEVVQNLKDMKQKSEDAFNELNEINSEIMDGLYPFTNLDENQLKRFNEVYKKVQKLGEKDRSSVTGYDELCTAYESQNSTKVSTILIISAAIGILILVGFVIFKRARKE